MKKIVVFSGAGISADSGLPTFRGEDGMWKDIEVSSVATVQAWEEHPDEVLEFFNRRRAALKDARPNDAHRLIAELERWYDVTVVTQNIDDLHERAGSTDIIHIHGELTLARPENTYSLEDGFCEEDITWIGYSPISLGDTGGCDRQQMRPHVVLFGEPTPKVGKASMRIREADILLVIGTSLQVDPAASLYDEVSSKCKVFVIDPNPSPVDGDLLVTHIFKKATEGIWDFFVALGLDLTSVLIRKWFYIDGKVDEPAFVDTVFYILDEHGRCLSKTYDGERLMFWYDAVGHVTQIEKKCVNVRSFEYDGDGYPVRQRIDEAGNESVIGYRWSRDRRKVDIWSDDRVRLYYRPDGRIKHMIKGWYPPFINEVFYKWDCQGNLTGVKTVVNAEDETLTFYDCYSPTGRREYMNSIESGVSFVYQNDHWGNWIHQEGRTPDGNIAICVERTIRYGTKGFSRRTAPDFDGRIEDDIQLIDWTKIDETER